MIDWKKERASKNYCGWCNCPLPRAQCTGSCFDDAENRRDHAKSELAKIPDEFEKLEKLHQALTERRISLIKEIN